MSSLKIGTVLLSIWSALNLLVAGGVTVSTLSGRSPPALAMLFTDSEIQGLDGRVLAVVNAQAALANPCIVALCMLALGIIWKGLATRTRWAFWLLTSSLVPLQMFGFVSDAFLGKHNLVANVISSLMLTTGLALSGYALHRGAPHAEPDPSST